MKQKNVFLFTIIVKFYLKFWFVLIMVAKKQNWIQTIAVYKDIRMLRILLLGAISGFPWVLIATSLSLWLKEEGLSRRGQGRKGGN